MMRPQLFLRTLTPAVIVSFGRCFSPTSGNSAARILLSSSALSSRSLTTSTSAMAMVSTSAAATFTAPIEENAVAIADLEPKELWTYFATLSSIPRPSKHEDAIINYIKSFANKYGLRYTEDKVGNLCVFRPGSGGGENAPPVIIQGHVDMVTEKNSNTNHDFFVDPIRLKKLSMENEETWIGAQGTTLGADNGIGVAAALALLETPLDDQSTPLPPIQALFTVDEETGLTGATSLDAQALELSGKTMLNLDTEEWGDLYVGCAGGGESIINIPLQREQTNTNTKVIELRVDGLMGGHSGINIHEGRANAVQLCALVARALLELGTNKKGTNAVNLVSILGGDKHNAIPREATAIFTISDASPEIMNTLEETVDTYFKGFVEEYGSLESRLSLRLNDVTDIKNTESCDNNGILSMESAKRLLNILVALPHGPIKFSHAMPDLVETSNNVASISTNEKEAIILCSTRSSIQSALEKTRDQITSIVTLAGGDTRIQKSKPYPGWNPNLKSNILDIAKTLLIQKYNQKKPGIKAIHAGLECGLLIEKLGGTIDTLSFGPTITGAHSPDEKVNASTVKPFYQLVKDILAELAKN